MVSFKPGIIWQKHLKAYTGSDVEWIEKGRDQEQEGGWGQPVWSKLSGCSGSEIEKTLAKHCEELIGHGEKISYGHKIMRAVMLQCSTISKVIQNISV